MGTTDSSISSARAARTRIFGLRSAIAAARFGRAFAEEVETFLKWAVEPCPDECPHKTPNPPAFGLQNVRITPHRQANGKWQVAIDVDIVSEVVCNGRASGTDVDA